MEVCCSILEDCDELLRRGNTKDELEMIGGRDVGELDSGADVGLFMT